MPSIIPTDGRSDRMATAGKVKESIRLPPTEASTVVGLSDGW
jgi:hypothetical protein